MIHIISDSPAYSMGADSTWEKPTSAQSEQDVNAQQVTLSWIQSLPPELKDAALYRLCKIVEAKPTLVESFALNQVLYRTISGGTFIESAESVAARTGCDRKTVLKGLDQAVKQNILEKNDRPGTSTKYSFKPETEWELEPVVRNKNTRTNKVIEFPSLHEIKCENEQSVRTKDDLATDANIVVVLKDLEEATTEVSIPVEDSPTSSRWKYVGQGLPRVYLPPELDQDTGKKIESIYEATKEPRQFIIKNAVDLLYNKLNQIPSFMEEEQKPAPFTLADVVINSIGTGSAIPDDVCLALKEAGIHLNLEVAERLWLKYSDSFQNAISYTVAQDEAGKIKHSKEGFFRKSLEEGWSFTQSPKQNQQSKEMPTHSLTPEQQAWYEWACQTSVCLNVPVRNLPQMMGRTAVLIPIKDRRPFDPLHDLVIIDVAMREHPI